MTQTEIEMQQKTRNAESDDTINVTDIYASSKVYKPDRAEFSPTEFDSADTPTKRNKRKLSEPKKCATDFSIKRFCPDSPVGSVADSADSETSEERYEELKLNETIDLSKKPKSCISLNIPYVPFHPTHTQQNEYLQSNTLINNNVSSSSVFDTSDSSNTELAAHILNVDKNKAPPRRFGHYPSESSTSTDKSEDVDLIANGKHRKNYKNMTRARRVEANARERTRVHTISAAFEALRRAVPSYSYNQKLSKLAILRIASTYILSLARLADMDSGCNTAPNTLSFADCVDLCTQTIQTEGRARRRH